MGLLFGGSFFYIFDRLGTKFALFLQQARFPHLLRLKQSLQLSHGFLCSVNLTVSTPLICGDVGWKFAIYLFHGFLVSE